MFDGSYLKADIIIQMCIIIASHKQLPSYSIWPTLLPSRSTVDPQQTTLNKMKMKKPPTDHLIKQDEDEETPNRPLRTR